MEKEFTQEDFDKLSKEEQDLLTQNVIEQTTALSKKFLEEVDSILKPYSLEMSIKFEVARKNKE